MLGFLAVVVLVACSSARGAGAKTPSLSSMLADYASLQGRAMDLLGLEDSRKLRPHPTQHKLLGHEDMLYNSLAAMSPLVVSKAGDIAKGGGREELRQWVGASLLSCADQSVRVLMAAAGEKGDDGWRLQYEARSSGIPSVNVFSMPSNEGGEGSDGELLLVVKFFVFPLGFDAMNAELLAFEQIRAHNREPESYRLREPLQHHRCLVSSDGGDRFFDSVIFRAVPGRSLTAMLRDLSSEVRHVMDIERTSGRLLSESTMEMLLSDHVKHISELHKELSTALAKTARALAELHLTTSRQDTPIHPEAFPQGTSLESALSAFFSVHPGLTQEQRAELITEAKTRLILAMPFFQDELACFMHGDVTPDNVLFHSDSGMVGILDLTSVPSSFVVAQEANSLLRSSYPAIPVRKEAVAPVGHAAWDYFYFVLSVTLVANAEPGVAELLPVEEIVQSHYCAYRLLPKDCVDRNLLWADEVANYYQYAAFAAISPEILFRTSDDSAIPV